MKKQTSYIIDPLYTEIPFSETIKKIIDTKVFQRLKNIKQVGMVSMFYPSATHTRFSHSLGIYYLAYYLTNNCNNLKEYLSKKDTIILQLACLLHDIGHGPNSHFFESITNVSHEKYTTDIILKDKECENLVCVAEG